MPLKLFLLSVPLQVGRRTGGHTGEDVNVYAFGPGKYVFSGVQENTNIAKRIFAIVSGSDPNKGRQ